MNPLIDTEQILDAYLSPKADRLSDRVIEAALADIARTPQRRALRVPWRFPRMPAFTHATGIAALAIVAVVTAGGLVYLDSPAPSGPGGPPIAPRVSQAPSAVPTTAPTPESSDVAPGITGWTMYTSEVHGFAVGYPEDWTVIAPATRTWQVGDAFPVDELPYADTLVSPGQGGDQVGLVVWEMPAGEGVDVETVAGLKTWAQGFCTDVGASSCEEFTQHAVPMCLNAGGDPCRGAILVPTAGQQYAFFVDWGSAMLTTMPDLVTVVVVARPDSFPSAARYGGSVELLKAILGTMDVWTPGQQRSS
jgi:hypothetical protein